jgi:hypothetical protein
VLYNEPSGPLAAERAVFVAQDRLGTHVGIRTDVLHNACPRVATSTPAPDSEGDEATAAPEEPAAATPVAEPTDSGPVERAP